MKVYKLEWEFIDMEDDHSRVDGLYKTKKLAKAAQKLIEAKYYKRRLHTWLVKCKIRTKLKI